MNQPDRYERFLLSEGTQKVVVKSDTKVEDAATFLIAQEDHTMGNLIRMQLHEDKSVIFAGYRIPHPLEHRMVVKVQTNGSKTPVQAFEHTLEDLRSEFSQLQQKFEDEFRLIKGPAQTPSMRY